MGSPNEAVIADDTPGNATKKSVKWFNSLKTKLLLVFFALLMLIGFSVTFVLDKNTRAHAIEQTLNFNREKGFALANRLGKEIVFIEMLAGGGLWPEPFAFDPDKERAGLLWHRDSLIAN